MEVEAIAIQIVKILNVGMEKVCAVFGHAMTVKKVCQIVTINFLKFNPISSLILIKVQKALFIFWHSVIVSF